MCSLNITMVCQKPIYWATKLHSTRRTFLVIFSYNRDPYLLNLLQLVMLLGLLFILVTFYFYFLQAKMWLTFNEPYVFIWLGYGTAVHAPGINSDPGRLPYIVTHNVIRAHSHAWHLYDDEFRSTQKGTKICIICPDSFSISYSGKIPSSNLIQNLIWIKSM